MTYREFVEWQVFWEREPFGFDSWQRAQQTALIYAAHRGKRGKKLTALDFMPTGTRQPKERPQSLAKRFHTFAKTMFGKVIQRTEDD